MIYQNQLRFASYWQKLAVTFFMPTVYIYSVFQKKSSPHKTFWNIFTSVKSFCVKSCKFVGNSYPHVCQFLCIYLNISSNGIYFSTSTHHFHRVKLWVLNADASWARTQFYTLTKSESWALLRKSAVESTARAQPFCVNQTVGLGDLPQRLHAQFVVIRQFFHC